MEYFSQFPEVIDGNGDSITNICLRVDFFNSIKTNAALFEMLQINDGERPEDIATLAYDDPTLYWVILWTNDITNTFTQWPLNSDELMDYVSQTYGAENIFAVHHYETIQGSPLGIGIIVNEGTEFSQSVTNFDYEDSVNEAKRTIKVLDPNYITQVTAAYATIFSQ
jgi:hypothetical protein